ncbi:hypothetical protein K432DRAFT_386497 [Lepidopterella palustris CBS 459.81]|uniref:Leucine-rich repeat domain-containing protein n=1 Tax=Lepidopterella palustris CBS 459.81 TaxID=1314670 RepID=A0A8E2E050_9PEZI|nr:hypothetical protein K432DRAFT_386497 [Lepidopterella palustris CBS 459.81]
MTQLLDLPTELVTQIIAHLSGRTNDLCNLCLVSLIMKSITEPILYYLYSYEMFKQAYSFRPFLRTIIRRPELAAHVRVAKIRVWNTPQDVDLFMNEPDPHLPADLRLFIEAGNAGDVPLSTEPAWFGSITRGVEDAEVMLLVSRLPKLQELHLRLPPSSRNRWTFVINEAKKALSREPAMFKSFKRLCVENGAGEGGFQLIRMTPFFRLPSLRTFEAYQCQDGPLTPLDFEKFAEKFRGSFSITSINIEWSSLSAEAVTAIITSCKMLRSFKYSHHYKVVSRLSTDQFSTLELVNALRAHRDTLEIMKLDLHSGWDPQMWLRLIEEEDDFRLGDIRDFTRLAVLDVEETALLTEDPSRQITNRPFVEAMPSSLEKLVVRSCSELILPHLQALATARKEYLQSLKRVEVTAIKEVVANVVTYNGKFWDEEDALSKAFKPDVEFKMKKKVDNGVWPCPLPSWRAS